MGKRIIRRSEGLWQDPDYIVNEAKKIIDQHGFETLPSSRILTDLGYFSFVSSISRYHGGFPAFRELLQKHMNQPSRGEKLEGMLEAYAG